MGTMMVALRWDGSRLTRGQLMDRAGKAANKVGNAFEHVDKLDIQAIPDENGQYVQLIVQTVASQADSEAMQKMLKDEFVA